MKKSLLYLLYVLLISATFKGISQNSTLYMTKEIKAAYEKGTRSWDGKPGKNYWQNTSNYIINASFEPDSLKITGNEIIEYQNYSPDSLNSIRLMLKQNLYKKGGMRDIQILEENVFEGVYIRNVIINNDTIDFKQPGKSFTYSTLFVLNLDSSNVLPPNSKIKIDIDWSLKIPSKYELRTGRVSDSAFFIGYWFPQIVVYDDVFKWDNLFYSGLNETYNDLSKFDVKIEVPGDFLVWATGDLQNPQEIYSTDFNEKIENSKITNEIVHLITPEELKNGNFLQKKKLLTWHFTCEKVPDFAFALSNNSVWDATSVVTDKTNKKRTWVNVVYPPAENQYKTVIKTSSESVAYFSDEFPGIPFPHQKHTTFFVGENSGGMEFPMMAANGKMQDSTDIVNVTAHEIAHSYFPFFVISNEEKYAWMDEGWVTTFTDSFLKTQGLKLTDNMMPYLVSFWNTENDIPLMTHSNYLHFYGETFYYYEKPVKANKYLFEIFEEKGISNPLKEFMNRWKYKHPTPYDYFFTLEDILGEDLSWFWKPWYFEFCTPDLKIEKITQNKNNLEIQISNPGKMPVAVALEIEFENGDIIKEYKTAYVWKGNMNFYIFNFKSNEQVRKVILGNNKIVDVYPEDNQWVLTSLKNKKR